MNSASILMNIATPAATGAPPADAQAGQPEGFTAALAALQENPAVQEAVVKQAAESPVTQDPEGEDVSALAIIASLLMQGPAAAANDAGGTAQAADAVDEGVPTTTSADLCAALSALTTAQSPATAQAPSADTLANSAPTATGVPQDPAAAALRALTPRGGKHDAPDAIETSSSSAAGNDGDAAGAGDRMLLDKLQEAFSTVQAPAATTNASVGAATIPAAAGNNTAANAAPPSVVAAAHLATTLTRDSAPDVSAPVHGTVHEPVGSPRWTEEIGSRLVLMSMRGQQEGSLTLTPEHLGPLEVQISVNKDTANVWFGAQHADTRSALTDAMPRLRELLAASGLSLGQSGVSEQAPRRTAGESASSRGGGVAAELNGAAEIVAAGWHPLRTGLIDTYA